MRVIFFALVLLSFPAIAVELSCEATYALLLESEARLKEVVEIVGKLRPEVVNGTVAPLWKDFDLLEKLAAKVQEIEAAHGGKDGEAIKELIHKTKEKFLDDPTIKKFAADLQAKKVKIDPTAYKPTEYELRRIYQDNLAKLNQHLPKGLRIPTARIPYANRNKQLVQQAEDLIRSQKEKFNKLYPTTGFKDEEDLATAIRASKDEGAHKLQTMLMNDQVEFAIQRPENARFWTPKVGFQNQHVTRTSKGSLNQDARDTVEAGFLGLEKNVVSAFDNDLKPKYGYLHPTPDSQLKVSSYAKQYGEDKYILKKQNLHDRVTFTVSDSLVKVPGYGRNETAHKPTSWDHLFVPWDNRQLLVPDLLPQFRGSYLTVPTYKGGGKVLEGILPEGDPLLHFQRPWATSMDYVEMQFWGPVTLDDVEVFEFMEQPPTGDFLKELQSRGIKIRDGRDQPPKAWNP